MLGSGNELISKMKAVVAQMMRRNEAGQTSTSVIKPPPLPPSPPAAISSPTPESSLSLPPSGISEKSERNLAMPPVQHLQTKLRNKIHTRSSRSPVSKPSAVAPECASSESDVIPQSPLCISSEVTRSVPHPLRGTADTHTGIVKSDVGTSIQAGTTSQRRDEYRHDESPLDKQLSESEMSQTLAGRQETLGRARELKTALCSKPVPSNKNESQGHESTGYQPSSDANSLGPTGGESGVCFPTPLKWLVRQPPTLQRELTPDRVVESIPNNNFKSDSSEVQSSTIVAEPPPVLLSEIALTRSRNGIRQKKVYEDFEEFGNGSEVTIRQTRASAFTTPARQNGKAGTLGAMKVKLASPSANLEEATTPPSSDAVESKSAIRVSDSVGVYSKGAKSESRRSLENTASRRTRRPKAQNTYADTKGEVSAGEPMAAIYSMDGKQSNEVSVVNSNSYGPIHSGEYRGKARKNPHVPLLNDGNYSVPARAIPSQSKHIATESNSIHHSHLFCTAGISETVPIEENVEYEWPTVKTSKSRKVSRGRQRKKKKKNLTTRKRSKNIAQHVITLRQTLESSNAEYALPANDSSVISNGLREQGGICAPPCSCAGSVCERQNLDPENDDVNKDSNYKRTIRAKHRRTRFELLASTDSAKEHSNLTASPEMFRKTRECTRSLVQLCTAKRESQSTCIPVGRKTEKCNHSKATRAVECSTVNKGESQQSAEPCQWQKSELEDGASIIASAHVKQSEAELPGIPESTVATKQDIRKAKRIQKPRRNQNMQRRPVTLRKYVTASEIAVLQVANTVVTGSACEAVPRACKSDDDEHLEEHQELSHESEGSLHIEGISKDGNISKIQDLLQGSKKAGNKKKGCRDKHQRGEESKVHLASSSAVRMSTLSKDDMEENRKIRRRLSWLRYKWRRMSGIVGPRGALPLKKYIHSVKDQEGNASDSDEEQPATCIKSKVIKACRKKRRSRLSSNHIQRKRKTQAMLRVNLRKIGLTTRCKDKYLLTGDSGSVRGERQCDQLTDEEHAMIWETILEVSTDIDGNYDEVYEKIQETSDHLFQGVQSKTISVASHANILQGPSKASLCTQLSKTSEGKCDDLRKSASNLHSATASCAGSTMNPPVRVIHCSGVTGKQKPSIHVSYSGSQGEKVDIIDGFRFVSFKTERALKRYTALQQREDRVRLKRELHKKKKKLKRLQRAVWQEKHNNRTEMEKGQDQETSMRRDILDDNGGSSLSHEDDNNVSLPLTQDIDTSTEGSCAPYVELGSHNVSVEPHHSTLSADTQRVYNEYEPSSVQHCSPKSLPKTNSISYPVINIHLRDAFAPPPFASIDKQSEQRTSALGEVVSVTEKSALGVSCPVPNGGQPSLKLPFGHSSIPIPSSHRDSNEPYFKTALEKRAWLGLCDDSDAAQALAIRTTNEAAQEQEGFISISDLRPRAMPRKPGQGTSRPQVLRGEKLVSLDSLNKTTGTDECVTFAFADHRQLLVRGSKFSRIWKERRQARKQPLGKTLDIPLKSSQLRMASRLIRPIEVERRLDAVKHHEYRVSASTVSRELAEHAVSAVDHVSTRFTKQYRCVPSLKKVRKRMLKECGKKNQNQSVSPKPSTDRAKAANAICNRLMSSEMEIDGTQFTAYEESSRPRAGVKNGSFLLAEKAKKKVYMISSDVQSQQKGNQKAIESEEPAEMLPESDSDAGRSATLPTSATAVSVAPDVSSRASCLHVCQLPHKRSYLNIGDVGCPQNGGHTSPDDILPPGFFICKGHGRKIRTTSKFLEDEAQIVTKEGEPKSEADDSADSEAECDHTQIIEQSNWNATSSEIEVCHDSGGSDSITNGRETMTRPQQLRDIEKQLENSTLSLASISEDDPDRLTVITKAVLKELLLTAGTEKTHAVVEPEPHQHVSVSDVSLLDTPLRAGTRHEGELSLISTSSAIDGTVSEEPENVKNINQCFMSIDSSTVKSSHEERNKCDKEWCRLGCVCHSLQCGVRVVGHCGKFGCMIQCDCNQEPKPVETAPDIELETETSPVSGIHIANGRRPRHRKLPLRYSQNSPISCEPMGKTKSTNLNCQTSTDQPETTRYHQNAVVMTKEDRERRKTSLLSYLSTGNNGEVDEDVLDATYKQLAMSTRIMLPRMHLPDVEPLCFEHAVHNCDVFLDGGYCSRLQWHRPRSTKNTLRSQVSPSFKQSRVRRYVVCRRELEEEIGIVARPRHQHTARTFGRLPKRRHWVSKPMTHSHMVMPPQREGSRVSSEHQTLSTDTMMLKLPDTISVDDVACILAIIPIGPGAGNASIRYAVRLRSGVLNVLTDQKLEANVTWKVESARNICVQDSQKRVFRNPAECISDEVLDVNSRPCRLWHLPVTTLNRRLQMGKMDAMINAGILHLNEESNPIRGPDQSRAQSVVHRVKSYELSEGSERNECRSDNVGTLHRDGMAVILATGACIQVLGAVEVPESVINGWLRDAVFALCGGQPPSGAPAGDLLRTLRLSGIHINPAQMKDCLQILSQLVQSDEILNRAKSCLPPEFVPVTHLNMHALASNLSEQTIAANNDGDLGPRERGTVMELSGQPHCKRLKIAVTPDTPNIQKYSEAAVGVSAEGSTQQQRPGKAIQLVRRKLPDEFTSKSAVNAANSRLRLMVKSGKVQLARIQNSETVGTRPVRTVEQQGHAHSVRSTALDHADVVNPPTISGNLSTTKSTDEHPGYYLINSHDEISERNQNIARSAHPIPLLEQPSASSGIQAAASSKALCIEPIASKLPSLPDSRVTSVEEECALRPNALLAQQPNARGIPNYRHPRPPVLVSQRVSRMLPSAMPNLPRLSSRPPLLSSQLRAGNSRRHVVIAQRALAKQNNVTSPETLQTAKLPFPTDQGETQMRTTFQQAAKAVNDASDMGLSRSMAWNGSNIQLNDKKEVKERANTTMSYDMAKAIECSDSSILVSTSHSSLVSSPVKTVTSSIHTVRLMPGERIDSLGSPQKPGKVPKIIFFTNASDNRILPSNRRLDSALTPDQLLDHPAAAVRQPENTELNPEIGTAEPQPSNTTESEETPKDPDSVAVSSSPGGTSVHHAISILRSMSTTANNEARSSVIMSNEVSSQHQPQEQIQYSPDLSDSCVNAVKSLVQKSPSLVLPVVKSANNSSTQFLTPVITTAANTRTLMPPSRRTVVTENPSSDKLPFKRPIESVTASSELQTVMEEQSGGASCEAFASPGTAAPSPERSKNVVVGNQPHSSYQTSYPHSSGGSSRFASQQQTTAAVPVAKKRLKLAKTAIHEQPSTMKHTPLQLAATLVSSASSQPRVPQSRPSALRAATPATPLHLATSAAASKPSTVSSGARLSFVRAPPRRVRGRIISARFDGNPSRWNMVELKGLPDLLRVDGIPLSITRRYLKHAIYQARVTGRPVTSRANGILVNIVWMPHLPGFAFLGPIDDSAIPAGHKEQDASPVIAQQHHSKTLLASIDMRSVGDGPHMKCPTEVGDSTCGETNSESPHTIFVNRARPRILSRSRTATVTAAKGLLIMHENADLALPEDVVPENKALNKDMQVMADADKTYAIATAGHEKNSEPILRIASVTSLSINQDSSGNPCVSETEAGGTGRSESAACRLTNEDEHFHHKGITARNAPTDAAENLSSDVSGAVEADVAGAQQTLAPNEMAKPATNADTSTETAGDAEDDEIEVLPPPPPRQPLDFIYLDNSDDEAVSEEQSSSASPKQLDSEAHVSSGHPAPSLRASQLPTRRVSLSQSSQPPQKTGPSTGKQLYPKQKLPVIKASPVQSAQRGRPSFTFSVAPPSSTAAVPLGSGRGRGRAASKRSKPHCPARGTSGVGRSGSNRRLSDGASTNHKTSLDDGSTGHLSGHVADDADDGAVEGNNIRQVIQRCPPRATFCVSPAYRPEIEAAPQPALDAVTARRRRSSNSSSAQANLKCIAALKEAKNGLANLVFGRLEGAAPIRRRITTIIKKAREEIASQRRQQNANKVFLWQEAQKQRNLLQTLNAQLAEIPLEKRIEKIAEIEDLLSFLQVRVEGDDLEPRMLLEKKSSMEQSQFRVIAPEHGASTSEGADDGTGELSVI